ncbi:MAG: MDR family oxidoreductase [Acidobacteriota bacterium]
MFNALFVDRDGDRTVSGVRSIEENALPPNDVLIDIANSTLNYKDALAVTGKGRIIRGELPFIPGVDLAGTVRQSASPDFSPAQRVVLNGGGLGENQWGGLSQVQRVSGTWLIPLPDSFSFEEAMIVGTAGYTAMLAAMTLREQGVTPESGDVLVTGASGGVGSFAVSILASRGYRVVASTGKANAHRFLQELGAAEVIDRGELSTGASKPLDSARWSGAVDTVGGETLAAVISQTAPHGSIAACGNASGPALNTTVFPFILRGIKLLGIDSNYCPVPLRREAWQLLSREVSPDALQLIRNEVIGLEQVADRCRRLASGEVRGRIVVDVNR